VSFVQAAIDAGHIVGCASDRTRSSQPALWTAHGTTLQFTGHKHDLAALRERFPAAVRCVHVGDTYVDEHYARAAGFEFWHVDEAAAFLARGWTAHGPGQ
jgi:phosphoglycolate phosphatase-like HAD superfamily hydrolase